MVQHVGNVTTDHTVDRVLPNENTIDQWEGEWICGNGNGCNSWGYWMNGQSPSGSELIWSGSSGSALNLYVATSDILSLQYSEACCGIGNGDNSGISCADIYFQYLTTPSPTEEPTTLNPTTNPTFSPSDSTTNPTNTPTARPSDEPTSNPTAFPSKDPSSSPSNDPTLSRSAITTSDPTTDPTTNPTENPSAQSLCETITVEIVGFIDEDSADEFITGLSDRDKLKITNMTHYAIAESAANYGVDDDSFYMELMSISGALSIDQNYCTFTHPIMSILELVIENEDVEICSIIKSRWISIFGNGVDGESINVTIAPFELSYQVKLPCS